MAFSDRCTVTDSNVNWFDASFLLCLQQTQDKVVSRAITNRANVESRAALSQRDLRRKCGPLQVNFAQLLLFISKLAYVASAQLTNLAYRENFRVMQQPCVRRVAISGSSSLLIFSCFELSRKPFCRFRLPSPS